MKMKTNYDLELDNIIKNLDYQPKLLLHSCCGPCSTAVIERLKNNFDITVYFFNPNIEPLEEYDKRKYNQIKVLEKYNIKYVDNDYNNQLFKNIASNLENAKEGGLRCYKCYNLRLKETAIKAKEDNFEYFTTTLTISPSKDSQIINQIGNSLSIENNIKYLPGDFKKNNGYLRSIELSKELDLYRQQYCGCLYSKDI